MRHETLKNKLRKFHTAFKHPVDEPYLLVGFDHKKNLRIKLIREEYKELMLAIDQKKNKEDILKELCDLVYVCIGFADTYGWNFDVAFNRVHISNMSKLDKNGEPIHRKDGKILKSELYKEPDLQDLV
jgi:NTP pyrophosphatase (non-canonical NTP hydrolase)|tara:strand:+ start:10298 stop:10681 length:384 start_codon:yes stop_codon:yes gene_type:complete